MATEHDPDGGPNDTTNEASHPEDAAAKVVGPPYDGDAPAAADTADLANAEVAETAPVAPAVAQQPAPAAIQTSNLAELTAELRETAAEIAEIAAQAGRLGIAIDAAKALREGTTPEGLRRLVLDRASAAADARDIVATPPSPVLPQTLESPIVAAAKRSASADAKA
jgi:hypothetical protein